METTAIVLLIIFGVALVLVIGAIIWNIFYAPEPETVVCAYDRTPEPEPEPVPVLEQSWGPVDHNTYFHFDSAITDNTFERTHLSAGNQIITKDAEFTIPIRFRETSPWISISDCCGTDSRQHELYFKYDTTPPVACSFSFINVTGISIGIKTIVPPAVSLKYTRLEKLKIRSNRYGQNHSNAIKISYSTISSAMITTMTREMDSYRVWFEKLQVSGPCEISLSQCTVREGTFTASTDTDYVYVKDCQLSKTVFSGSYNPISIVNTDLSGVTFKGNPRVHISRCIGNGTTIKHLSHGNLFINWTSDMVFISRSVNANMVYLLSQVDAITEYMTDHGFGSDSGWIIDYIMDHPAEPFEQGMNDGNT